MKTARYINGSTMDATGSVDAWNADAGAMPESTREPLLVMRPSQGWSSLNAREVWEFRELLWTLTVRDLKLRYKQTALGVIWVVLQPLMAAGVFAFVFGVVAKLPTDGVPPFLLAYTGLLGWNLFNNTVTKASVSLTGNSQLISKVYFPRLILPLTTALSVTYRDVQYVLPVVLQILLYAGPTAYSASAVPSRWRTLFYLNPVSGPLEAFRASLLGTPFPRGSALWYAAAVSTVCLAAGLYLFKRMERKFADVI